MFEEISDAEIPVVGSLEWAACIVKRAIAFHSPCHGRVKRLASANVAKQTPHKPTPGAPPLRRTGLARSRIRIRPMTYVVVENCIKCKYTDCVEVCPVDCFYEGENMLVIHPDECIDCGVCEPECPAEAIKPDTGKGLDSWLKLNLDMAKSLAQPDEKTPRACRSQGDGWQGREAGAVFGKSRRGRLTTLGVGRYRIALAASGARMNHALRDSPHRKTLRYPRLMGRRSFKFSAFDLLPLTFDACRERRGRWFSLIFRQFL